MPNLPDVTVITVNYNGAAMLETCLASLLEVDYPPERMRVIVADNASTDGSVELLRTRFPWVEVLETGANLGFGGAVNLAAAEATSPVLVFLNNDTEPEPDFLRHLTAALEQPGVAAAGAKICSWDGKEVLFAGGASNFHGIGIEIGRGEPDGPDHDHPGPTLFPCGAAMAIDRKVFLDIGGFDEDFFLYYEDVDLGWRCWVAGHEVVFEPRARVRHRDAASSSAVSRHRIRVLHMRNPLYTIFKNYGDEALRRVLPASLMVNLKRTFYLFDRDPDEFRLGSQAKGEATGAADSASDSMLALADLVAYHDFVTNFDRLLEKRARVQGMRARPDSEILPLLRDPFRSCEQDPRFESLLGSIAEFWGLPEIFTESTP